MPPHEINGQALVFFGGCVLGCLYGAAKAFSVCYAAGAPGIPVEPALVFAGTLGLFFAILFSGPFGAFAGGWELPQRPAIAGLLLTNPLLWASLLAPLAWYQGKAPPALTAVTWGCSLLALVGAHRLRAGPTRPPDEPSPPPAVPGLAVTLTSKVDGATCPYCLDALVDRGQVAPCPGCQTRHHVECYSENRGCTILGCPQRR